MATFDKLRFYIIKCHKGNKNTRMHLCIEMYGEVRTFGAIGQQVTYLEFPSIPGSSYYYYLGGKGRQQLLLIKPTITS